MKILVLALLFCAPVFAQSKDYRYDGDAILNNLEITPGAVFATSTKEVLCDKSFHTGTIRSVSQKTKFLACEQYGITRADCNGKTFEIDHLISLELGGSNDIKNLWPEPYNPQPGAKVKDVVENYLHKQVCKGNISLEDAQKEISTDWYKVYETIPQKK